MAAQVQAFYNDSRRLYDELHQMYPEVAENDLVTLIRDVCTGLNNGSSHLSVPPGGHSNLDSLQTFAVIMSKMAMVPKRCQTPQN